MYISIKQITKNHTDMDLLIIATYGKDELEFKVENFEDDLEHFKKKVEQEKDIMFLQEVVTKDLPIIKLGNIYKKLEILHNNISKYDIKISLKH